MVPLKTWKQGLGHIPTPQMSQLYIGFSFWRWTLQVDLISLLTGKWKWSRFNLILGIATWVCMNTVSFQKLLPWISALISSFLNSTALLLAWFWDFLWRMRALDTHTCRRTLCNRRIHSDIIVYKSPQGIMGLGGKKRNLSSLLLLSTWGIVVCFCFIVLWSFIHGMLLVAQQSGVAAIKDFLEFLWK